MEHGYYQFKAHTVMIWKILKAIAEARCVVDDKKAPWKFA